MSEETYQVLFLVGVAIMAIGVGFAWWVKLRVVWLRQDIYDLRDELFMESVRRDCVTDPSGEAARGHLNALAQIAPYLSIQFIGYLIHFELLEACQLPKSADPAFDDVIESIMRRADARIERYLFRETATGLLLLPLSRLISMAWIEEKIVRWIREWRRSSAAEKTQALLKSSRAA